MRTASRLLLRTAKCIAQAVRYLQAQYSDGRFHARNYAFRASGFHNSLIGESFANGVWVLQ